MEATYCYYLKQITTMAMMDVEIGAVSCNISSWNTPTYLDTSSGIRNGTQCFMP
jgi:hypothetical protein